MSDELGAIREADGEGAKRVAKVLGELIRTCTIEKLSNTDLLVLAAGFHALVTAKLTGLPGQITFGIPPDSDLELEAKFV